MERVLVTDCWTRKSLVIARSLGKEGLEVHTAGHKSLTPTRFSRYSKKFFLVPNPEKYPEEYKKKILSLLRNTKYECIIPIEELTISLLYDVRSEIEKYTIFPLVSKEKFMKAYDKWETLQIAKKVKVPMPESYCPQSEEEVAAAIKKLTFPIVIKPRKSSGSRGLKIVQNIREFKENYPFISKKYGRPILQECIKQSGQGMPVGFIIKDKKVLADFSYKRLREYPLSGGPSTVRESTDDSLIKEYGKRLLDYLDWYGAVVIEFKVDPKDGKPKLMEINPRLWGSLALSLVSGVNFPYLLYLLAKNRKFEKPKYRIGVRCRWLIPGDILHFISNSDRFNLNPSFFDFFDKNTYYDDLTSEDLPGTFASIIFNFLSILDWEIWKKGVFRR